MYISNSKKLSFSLKANSAYLLMLKLPFGTKVFGKVETSDLNGIAVASNIECEQLTHSGNNDDSYSHEQAIEMVLYAINEGYESDEWDSGFGFCLFSDKEVDTTHPVLNPNKKVWVEVTDTVCGESLVVGAGGLPYFNETYEAATKSLQDDLEGEDSFYDEDDQPALMLAKFNGPVCTLMNESGEVEFNNFNWVERV